MVMTRLSYASTKNKDMKYAVKIDILDDFFFLETEKRKYIFLDHREFGFFQERNKDKNIEGVLVKGGSRNDFALALIREYSPNSNEIAVPAYFPLDLADFLRERGVTLKITRPYYEGRAVKNSEEINMIESSVKKTHSAFLKIEEILNASEIKAGLIIFKGEALTSEFLKREVEEVLFNKGMLNTEGMIISSGKDAAISHHQGQGKLSANQTIVCDIFPVSKKTGYFADVTRTYIKGKPNKKIMKMYDSVLRAQEAAFRVIKPGIIAKEIHKAVADSIINDGFDVGDTGFTHGTGHGLGLEVHEAPHVNRTSEDVLRPGSVFTIEPGLYYANLGGVRIEDVVFVTNKGYRNLTNFSDRFIIE
ncbi:hypothetical protein A3H65_01430 [Candidatus Giovannonibacteria bacterium RIFCSPLOWO2_02_FULL_45_14]|uniref:Peptidase M24 domain-containing protein n=1 Tax=Candidatus Giovannonibacteria bacterium RIFCSPLOWO2_12_FULL_44_15 TaxID=1798364 RepID=A0A1F5XZC7_9BACT|nr:MAG: hypothetical protein A3C75_03330 [Candidatus Giovannonibacteria bacterium RIFCSPHIGHO2_02_FULL_44_31]OGF77054.1 MAG: hypothetical protein A3E62_02505 [Candidatus Giovannonibacteria bacterium RIFCSPHIGHO2_12_FULL_44_29]OGF90807.1 MAG: hypothetical protein A3H65_01430 [Candidatus Giovannonibacteria bacterium RIFCSPLOWO2_02_FULL_45_14]OGF93233.1 MAG: hypothetical protein A3G54_01345 [Candidatus Giovannonibacteria bacterium RIFCSPLOWO2_12_FULL_44_15]